MLMMTDCRLDQIAERLALWKDFGDPESFTADDAAELLGEVRYLRRVQDREVRLLRRARAELVRISDSYHELQITARAWAERKEPPQ